MSQQQVNLLVSPAHRLAPGTARMAEAIASLAAAAALQLAAWRDRRARNAELRRRARGRAELQALAARYMATQPSFAKELLYAAMNERDD
jgi:hypothetical protein